MTVIVALRGNQSSPLTESQVDGNFSGLASAVNTNTAAIAAETARATAAEAANAANIATNTTGLANEITRATAAEAALNSAKTNVADLAAASGATLIGFKNSTLASAIQRIAADKLMDAISIKDFGAFWDGNSHPLSSVFSTLTAAQVVYPHATSLTNEFDWAALQASANQANGRTVTIPVGKGIVPMKVSILKRDVRWIGQSMDRYNPNTTYGSEFSWTGGAGTMIELGAEKAHTTGSITATQNTLTVASVTGYNQGNTIKVVGAGASGGDLYAQINSIAGSVLTLSANAGTTVSGADVSHAYNSNEYDGPQTFTFKYCCIRPSNPATALANGNGNYLTGAYFFRDWAAGDLDFEVQWEQFDVGFWGIQSDINTFNRCRAFYNRQAMYLGPRSDQNVIRNLYAFYNDNLITFDGCNGTKLENVISVGNGSSSTYPFVVTQGTGPIDVPAFWLESLAGQTAFTVDAFFDLGNVVGYGNNTNAAVGMNFGSGYVYTNPNVGGVLRTSAFISLGKSIRNYAKEFFAPAGQSLNLDYFVKVPAAANWDGNASNIAMEIDFNNAGKLLQNNSTMGGAPAVSYSAATSSSRFIGSATGRLIVTRIGGATGANQLLIGQENQPGQIVMQAVGYSTGSQVRFKVVNAIVPGTAAPVTGTWEVGDKVPNTVQTVGSPEGWVCVTGGTPGTWNTYGWVNLVASTTWDPPSIANGAQTTTTVTATGAALGDFAMASFSLSLAGLQLTAYVSSANTVTVVLANNTGGAVDLASGTLKVCIKK